MNVYRRWAFYAVLLTLCLSMSGCVSSQVEQLGNGYEEITYKTRSIISEPDAYQITLQYRDAKGMLNMIWPSVGGGPIMHGDTAIFIGDPQHFLFAVQAPGTLLEITVPVLRQWSKETGKDLAEAIRVRDSVLFKQIGNQLEFHFPTWNEDKVVRLDWNQISDIMREVKETGVSHQDTRWGITYLGEELQPGKTNK
jgi:hypothetical protein